MCSSSVKTVYIVKESSVKNTYVSRNVYDVSGDYDVNGVYLNQQLRLIGKQFSTN